MDYATPTLKGSQTTKLPLNQLFKGSRTNQRLQLLKGSRTNQRLQLSKGSRTNHKKDNGIKRRASVPKPGVRLSGYSTVILFTNPLLTFTNLILASLPHNNRATCQQPEGASHNARHRRDNRGSSQGEKSTRKGKTTPRNWTEEHRQTLCGHRQGSQGVKKGKNKVGQEVATAMSNSNDKIRHSPFMKS